jgi:hypothetical protein
MHRYVEANSLNPYQEDDLIYSDTSLRRTQALAVVGDVVIFNVMYENITIERVCWSSSCLILQDVRRACQNMGATG